MGRLLNVGKHGGMGIVDRRFLTRDMEKVQWEPVSPLSIFDQFDRWFNVTAYKYTGDEIHIQEEFRHV